MIVCQNCKHTNPPPAVACHQCGVQLDRQKLQGTITIPQPKNVPLARFTLAICPTSIGFNTRNAQINLAPDPEIYLGREFADDFSDPYLDLHPFNATAFGVSRLHARLQQDSSGRYHILEVDSTNGMFLNGDRIAIFGQYPLPNKSLLTLGRFPIWVQFTDG